MSEQAWAQNAVIVEDNGRNVRWKPRCPFCGFIPPYRTAAGTAFKGIRANHHDRCDKCGKQIDIVVSRG